MREEIETVFIVDDDVSVRESLEAIVALEGFAPRAFDSAHAFLADHEAYGPRCLVLDVGLPDLNGIELQSALRGKNREMPIIFITGHGDIPMTVRAMKAGALEFLTKPFSDDVLLSAVRGALERSRAILQEQLELQSLLARYETLTARERQVLSLVVTGLLNKQIAHELGISEITVKVHRGRVMEKMKARSLAQLVTLNAALERGLVVEVDGSAGKGGCLKSRNEFSFTLS